MSKLYTMAKNTGLVRHAGIFFLFFRHLVTKT